MTVAEKYRLELSIGWGEGTEVFQGPTDTARRVPTAVKIWRGSGEERERFIAAARDQQTAGEGGCKQVAPIYESGRDGEDAYYVTRRFARSVDSLIKGRAVLEADALGRIASGALKALEELRDRQQRSHGNLKPANIFLEGKNAQSATVFLGDLAPRAGSGDQAADCYALGAVIVQLVRSRAVRNFDWPIVTSPEWERLGSDANGWREFCNVLMSPETASRPDALAVARDAYKHMDDLGEKAEERSRDIAEASGETYHPPARSRKGLWASLGAAVVAVTGSAALLSQPADSHLGQTLRNAPMLAALYKLVDVPKVLPTPPGGKSDDGTPTPTPTVARVTPTPPAVAASSPSPKPTVEPSPTGSATPEETPMIALETPSPETPSPTPDAKEQAKADYIGRLEQIRRILDDPTTKAQPEGLNGALAGLKSIDTYQSVAFVKNLPPNGLEASAEEPDLPAGIWQKQAANASNPPGSTTYTHKSSGASMTFNKVTAADGQGFYVAATTVPMGMGRILAKAQGATPLGQGQGATSWQLVNGECYLRSLWIDDVSSKQYYTGKGNESLADQQGMSVMNGLSALQAAGLAKAAGCSLPTLSQWKALLASPAGTYWAQNWKGVAKLRGAAWSVFTNDLRKGESAGRVTRGVKLPNDQCFGDTRNLDAVGTDSPSFFFEPVNLRLHEGFCHLIGNVGQYVTSDGGGGQYYFAGGSAESPPSVFANGLDNPPSVPGPIAYADGSLRLVAKPARKSGSDQSFTKLSDSLNAELARARSAQSL